MNKVAEVLKEARKLTDRNLSRKIRIAALDTMSKTAGPGILQHPHPTPVEYKTRDHVLSERGGVPMDRKKIYDTGPEHKKSDLSVDEVADSLSTRYSPDRVGVQARRLADGVFQDPITNRIYDWNEGFRTETGDDYTGSDVSLQTDIL